MEQETQPTLKDRLNYIAAFLGRQILKEPILASSNHYRPNVVIEQVWTNEEDYIIQDVD